MTVSFPDGADDPVVKKGALDELIADYGLDSKTFANVRTVGDKLEAAQLQLLNACRAPAVQAGVRTLETVLTQFMARERPINEKRFADLATRMDAFGQLQFNFLDDLPEGLKAARQSWIDRRQAERVRARDNFKIWVEAHREPSEYRHCQIVAVFLSK